MPHLPFIESLNTEQREAVLVTKKHLRVLAGAGSGKTQVLVCRIAARIQIEQLLPSQFLAVTFTNKAAREMRTRLSEFIREPSHTLWVGTFHHLAHRILRIHYEAAGLSKDFQIIDTADQQRRIKRIIQTMNLDETRFSPKSVQGFISQQKDAGVGVEQFVPSSSIDPYQKTLHSLYKTYEESCRRDHVLDFSDLLLRSRALLQRNPEILELYHNRFRYILVDEFQDTNGIQYDWIRLLIGKNTYLTVVGDDDQSIYGWRGAQIENMHRFEQDFPNGQTIRLEQNYRSSSTILAAANALISHNQNRLGKNLWTQSNPGEPIQLYEALSDLDEARFIVERIQRLKDTQTPFRDIALLYRSNAQSRVLEEGLMQANIPYRVYGGLRFFERSEIKDTLAYLRLINNIHDNAAFERVINTPSRGIGEKTLQIIRDTARQETISYTEASQRLLRGAVIPARGANALRAFFDLLKEIAQNIEDYTLDMQIEHVFKESGLLAHYQKESVDTAQTRLENVNELVRAASQFSSDTEDATLSNFLNKMTLESSEHQTEDAVDDSVQLMTLHAAKGLEFPIVFLTGLEEGLFPSHLSLDTPKSIEEERRLCYVGITRAMRQLYLTYAKIRFYRGAESYRLPSRFIEEIPTEYLNTIRNTRSRADFSEEQTASYTISPKQAQIADTIFQLHQRVRHPRFGTGTIVDAEGEGAYTRVKVKFDTAGLKWLILHFAKLEPVYS